MGKNIVEELERLVDDLSRVDNDRRRWTRLATRQDRQSTIEGARLRRGGTTGGRVAPATRLGGLCLGSGGRRRLGCADGGSCD